MSIEAVGVLATIQVSSGNAISVSAGASDIVVLRGLTLEGLGTATHGIAFSSGDSLYVENCRINKFGTYGINFGPTSSSAASKLFIADTIVRNNGSGTNGCGVYIQPSGVGFAQASIDGLRTENNVCGVKVVDGANVTIRNSVAANNGFAGFSTVASGNVPHVLIESSVSTHNGTYGVLSANLTTSFSAPVVRLNNVTTTDNVTGMATSGSPTSGLILSFGNNKNDGNGTNGAPTSTVSQQ